MDAFGFNPVNPNIRKSKESQEAFKKRRREETKAGRGGSAKMLWPSEYRGTYVRAKHGPLGV